jgi:hypothetical protein
MKRLLIITHVFPPAPSPGALRPGYLARYLPQFGWEATVLTATSEAPPFPAQVLHVNAEQPSLQTRLRNRFSAQHPASPLRSLLRAAKETLFFPDMTAPWMAPGIAAGAQALRSEHFDAVLSTAHPASAHVIAWILARRFSLPWIADYRDPWAGNRYLRRGPVRGLLERLLERGMLRRARAITTISHPIAEQLARFHRRGDIHVIPNAYDPSDWNGVPEVKPARFELVFTGSMYDGKRSPDLLFAAIAQLRAEGNPAGDVRVHFYGKNSENVIPAASRYGVNLLVRQHGEVPRLQAMRAQRGSAALLIFLNIDPATGTEMGSKYLEYLGAHRPIMAFGPSNSAMRTFLSESRLGWFASNVDEARDAVCAAHAHFQSGAWQAGAVPRSVPSATELAANFAYVLDAACGFKAPSNTIGATGIG